MKSDDKNIEETEAAEEKTPVATEAQKTPGRRFRWRRFFKRLVILASVLAALWWSVKTFPAGTPLKWKADKEGFLTISIPAPDASAIDTVIEIDGASL